MQKNLAEPLFKERAITYATARRILLRNMTSELDMPTCFIGPPGVGKTCIVEDVAREMNANLCVIPLSCYDASELKGIPRVIPIEEIASRHPDRVKKDSQGLVTFYARNFEFPDTDDPDAWIFFFDEFNTVPPSTQVPIFQATQKRCITGSYKFPKINRVVLAGNRLRDSEAAKPIPSPIISRVNMHEVTYDTREWLDWGKHIHPGIRSFLSRNQDRLCFFTKEMIEAAQPYPTPRTWEYASNILKAYPDATITKLEPKDQLWEDLVRHLAGSVGHEVVTWRDGEQKTLIHYIQIAAQEALHLDADTLKKVQRMVQTFEQSPEKPTALIILQLLPTLPSDRAAIFLKRMQSVTKQATYDGTLVTGKELVTQLLKEKQKTITKSLLEIPGLKETLTQLK